VRFADDYNTVVLTAVDIVLLAWSIKELPTADE
jgi:hypothetical protein